MANIVTGVNWEDADRSDIHVLAGQSPVSIKELFKLKKVFFHNTTTNTDGSITTGGLPPGVTTRFVAELAGATSVTGVSVNATTGEITISSPLPTPRLLFNFQIRFEIVNSDTPPTVFRESPKIRVHVHKQLTRAWLTPNPLALRKGANDQRLTVLGEFDDQTVGDITRTPGIAWSSDTTGQVGLGSEGRLLVNGSGGQAKVTATLPAPWNKAPFATVNTLPAWADVTGTATLIGDSPGADKVNDVVNVLFLPDGFDKDQEPEFQRTVQQVVTALRKNVSTNPFVLVRDAINYWRVWIPSADRGCSVLNEVATYQGKLSLRAKAMPLAREPAPPPATGTPPTWELDELLNEVGLPTQADLLHFDPKTQTIPQMKQIALDRLALKLKDWRKVYGTKVDIDATHHRIDPSAFVRWCICGDRVLLDEQSTALGISLEYRPNRDPLGPDPTLTWNPRRTTRAQLDDFLKKLKPGGGTLAPWAPGGKDHAFVFVIAAVGFDVGERTREPNAVMTTSLTADTDIAVTKVSGRQHKLVPLAIPKTVSVNIAMTVAHEATHAMGDLSDESAGAGGAWPDGDGIAALNLQNRGSLLVSNKLHAFDIKWRWPRITKATLLAKKPEAQAPNFRVFVKAGDEKLFDPTDIVEVRGRPLVQSVDVKTSGPLKIVEIKSGELVVKPFGTANPTPFKKDDLVYVARRNAPTAAQPAGEPLLLVGKTISDHINAVNFPLNTKVACNPKNPNRHEVQTAVNLPAGLPFSATRVTAHIVGLYEGGAHRQCGIYHPAGACLMRRVLIPLASPNFFPGPDPFSAPVEEESTEPYPLCWTCQYVLVDKLDPRKHGRVDDFYAHTYPG